MKLQFSTDIEADIEDTDWSTPIEVDVTRWANKGDEERICSAIEDKAEEWAERHQRDTACEWPDRPNEYTRMYALVDGQTLYEMDILMEYSPTFSVADVTRKTPEQEKP